MRVTLKPIASGACVCTAGSKTTEPFSMQLTNPANWVSTMKGQVSYVGGASSKGKT